jgi:secreted PhoX family phosphatase
MNAPADLPRHARSIDDDEDLNPTTNPDFQQVLQARLSRRSLLRGGVGSAATAVLGSWSLAACGGGDDDQVPAPAPAAPAALDKVAFASVPKSVVDTLTVPAGYTATVIYAVGDPLDAATPAYKNDGTDTGFETRAGDHHDGMYYFGLSAAGARDASSNDRGLLAMNHEALTDNFLHVNGSSARPRPAAESDKEIPAHGISIVEVAKSAAGAFSYVRGSSFNRRITPLTPLELSGPVRGNALVKTKYSTAGTGCRGTINNCGSGYTPWGTYLSGEENWNGYFTRGAADNAARGNDRSVTSLNRYGKAQGSASRHGWETSGADDRFARWDISKLGASTDGTDDYRNELNTFGYVVEVDPYDKAATLKKRTALGRYAHESADFGKLVAGKPLAVYMGDDSRGEYMYKFVSTANWDAADATPASRIAAGDKYLDAGKLYVAKFNADGTGNWLELTISATAIASYAGYAFADQADVLVNARIAADALGATKMDRPEWCAVHPTTGEIYYSLTNNSGRKVQAASASEQSVDGPNPRSYIDPDLTTGTPQNGNGHIIRIKETGGESAATTFTWDIYLFGSQANGSPTLVNLSGLSADQDFSSPDGLWFSRNTGLCWIQTDDGAYTDVTNCMLLAGVPGGVGDGAKTTLSYAVTGGTVSVDTYVGKKPTADTLRRFLVGPKDCEITGITETPDGKAVFVNIQHPGETIVAANVADPTKYLSHWPGNAGYQATAGNTTSRPRSSTIVITKNDGGRIGT